MSDNKPKEDDAVLGGNNSPPVNAAVLGGMEGVKQRFDRASSDEDKIAILKKALLYGEAGEEWLSDIISTEKNKIQWVAAALMSATNNEIYKELLVDYFANFLPNHPQQWNELDGRTQSLSVGGQGRVDRPGSHA